MQFGLQFSKSSTIEISRNEIDGLAAFLFSRGWVKASAIEAALGFDERKIRAIAEASEGMIISGPGCPGYMLFSSAEQLPDVDQAANRLESQANRMLLRAETLRRRAKNFIAR